MTENEKNERVEADTKNVHNRKSSHAKKENSWYIRIIYTLAIIMVLAAVRAGIRAIGSTTTKTKPELIAEAVESVKLELNPPRKIDDITTLTDVKAGFNSIDYYYDVSEGYTLEQAKVVPQVTKSICTNEDTKYVLDEDIDMNFNYSVPSSVDISFTVTATDC